MNRHSKTTHNNNPKSNSCHNNEQEQERYISGNIGVVGQVEANFPRELIEEYKTSNRQAHTRENARDRREVWRFRVEIITLIFVVFVALLSIIQSRQSVRTANAAAEANKLAKANFWLDERPFIDTRFTGMPHPVPEMLGLPVASFAYKNYGKGPALRVRVATWIFTGPTQEQEVESWFSRMGDGPIDESNTDLTLPTGETKKHLVLENFVMPGQEITGASIGYKPFDDVGIRGTRIVARIEYYDLGGNRY